MKLTKEETIKKHYDSKVTDDEFEAQDYVLNGVPFTREQYDFFVIEPLLENLELSSKSRVLDAGCGAGTILKAIENTVAHAEGFDLSENLVKRFNGKSKVYVSSAKEVVFKPKSFDRIYMISVGIHFPDLEYFKAVVLNLFSALDDDGILIVGDQLIADFYNVDKYLCIPMVDLVSFLRELACPYSIIAQKKEKREMVGGRFDIVIYKDKKQ